MNVDARAGRSCHVSGLFVRPCSMAAGHNALRRLGPGHVWTARFQELDPVPAARPYVFFRMRQFILSQKISRQQN